jgi:hypothetical protein
MEEFQDFQTYLLLKKVRTSRTLHMHTSQANYLMQERRNDNRAMYTVTSIKDYNCRVSLLDIVACIEEWDSHIIPHFSVGVHAA